MGGDIFIQPGYSNQQAFEWRGPAQVAAVLKSPHTVEAFSDEISVPAVGAVPTMSCIRGVGERPALFTQRNVPEHIAAYVGDGDIAQVSGIDTLGQQGKCVKEIQVLSVIV